MELPADAPVGMDIREYLSLDDKVIELGLTPNRADCLSIRGVARDVAVAFDEAFNEPAIESVSAVIGEEFPVAIEATAKCPRYLGRVIKNVDLSRPARLHARAVGASGTALNRCGGRRHELRTWSWGSRFMRSTSIN